MARTLRSVAHDATVVSCLRREADEQTALLTAFAALYVQGGIDDWTSLYPHGTVCRALPTYAWDRQRVWPDACLRAPSRASGPVSYTHLTLPTKRIV